MRFYFILLMIALLTSCATTHKPPPPLLASSFTMSKIGPYAQPHGRILLLGNHRAQLLFNCQQTALGGTCRFTHGASGRIIELRWQGQQIWQRSNEANHQQWQQVSMQSLYKMGLVVHPAAMMQLLNGVIPSWLHPKADNRWQGEQHKRRIQMQWYPDQHRLDITNLSKGAQVRLLLKP